MYVSPNGGTMLIQAVFGLCLLGICSCWDCQDRWTEFEGSCYLFTYGKNLSFVEAEHYCNQHGGSHLVHIETREENLFIKDVIRAMKAPRHWIGLSDENVEGIWKWYGTNVSPTFTDWGPGNPDNSQGIEDCVEFYMYPDQPKWNDAYCNDINKDPICEIRVGESGPVVG